MNVTRRSFLSLVIGAPVAAALARVDGLVLPAEPAIVVPEVAEESLAFERALRGFRVMRYALPFASEGVPTPPGGFARLVARPQLPFRPERLLCSENQFEIFAVAANGEPQLEDSMPSEAFAVEAYGQRLQFQAIGPGQEIVMVARNRGNEARTFMATMIGAAADNRPIDPAELERERAHALELDDELGEDWDEEDEDHELDDDEIDEGVIS
jgi:hypothetical protein